MKWLWLWPAAMSLVCFLAMARDKRAAVRGAYRTPETTLLALAVLGGSPGGILAMLLLRHKLRKSAFSVGLPLILLVQAALAWVILRAG